MGFTVLLFSGRSENQIRTLVAIFPLYQGYHSKYFATEKVRSVSSMELHRLCSKFTYFSKH